MDLLQRPEGGPRLPICLLPGLPLWRDRHQRQQHPRTRKEARARYRVPAKGGVRPPRRKPPLRYNAHIFQRGGDEEVRMRQVLQVQQAHPPAEVDCRTGMHRRWPESSYCRALDTKNRGRCTSQSFGVAVTLATWRSARTQKARYAASKPSCASPSISPTKSSTISQPGSTPAKKSN